METSLQPRPGSDNDHELEIEDHEDDDPLVNMVVGPTYMNPTPQINM